MTSPLDSLIATRINSRLGPKLQDGSVRRSTAGGVDEYGDPTGGTVVLHAFKGYRDSFSATYKANASIPATDYEIGILARSCVVEPSQGDEIFFKGQWSKVREVLEIDPAGALIRLQCYDMETPASA